MRLAVFVSGKGTNLLNIIKKHEDGFLKSEVRLVISDHACDAVENSKRAGIETRISTRRILLMKQNSERSFSAVLKRI